jgi:spore germination protein YaaH
MPVLTNLLRPAGRAIGPRRLAAALGATLLLGLTGAGGALGNGSATVDTDQDSPSIHYREATAHAADATSFVPGAAVSVPYTPRAGDHTIIDGAYPVALPAGSATGVAMAASAQGSVWAAGETDPPSGGSDKQVLATPSQGTTAGGGTAPAATTNVLRREVYGFLPYWRLGSAINYDVVSTIAYFGVDLYTNGDINKQQDGKTTTGWAGWTSSAMTSVIDTAHAHHVRVALTIESFAWGTSGAAAQTELLSSTTNRQNAVAQIAAAIRDRGADGVNIDFEPIASGQSANFVTFIRELRIALDAIHAGYELTFCATGHIGNYDVANLLATGAADNVFIMGYDFRNGASPYAASHDPLTSPRVYDLTDAVNSYRSRAPASKILLGLPYYGIAYSTSDTSLYSTNRSGTTYGDAVWVPYYTAADLAKTNLVQYDTIEESAWVSYYGTFGGASTWRELYYNDARAMAARYDRVNYWGIGGVGIWVLGYDAGYPELNQVLADKFLIDRTPPKAGITNMAADQLSESFTISWTGSDDWNGVKSYDVQVAVDGGAWTDWLTGTTITSSSFNGATGHSYAFRVRATDGVGNVGSWDVTTSYTATPSFTVNGYAKVVAGPVAERGQPTISSNAIFTVGNGTVFQIIGGPVSADGYTWYQVNGPITEMNSVPPTFPGCWVAVYDASTNYLIPITPPNTTSVAAGIAAYKVGTPGSPPSMTGVEAGHTFSPDGDGIRDTIALSWVNMHAFTGVSLSIYRPDGGLAGVKDLGAQGTGAQTFTWDGTVSDREVQADGQYMLRLAATTDEGTVYYAPSEGPFDAVAWASFGVILDTTPSGTYTPMPPQRILDTRISLGLTGAYARGVSRPFPVAGHYGVPAGAMAVTGNLTITGATVAGFLRLGSSTAGNFSTINFGAGDSRANGVTLGLAEDGSLSALYMASRSATVHVIFDLTGYFLRDPGGSTFMPVTPTRIVDTRTMLGLTTRLVANTVATFKVSGRAGVPDNATAVVGNATIVGQEAAGYITIAPSIGPGVPTSSTLNFPYGDIRANNVTVALSDGNLQVEYRAGAGRHAHFVFDVTGYFVPGLSGATFVPLSPGRIVDSRVPQGLPGPLKASAGGKFAVRGQVSVPLAAVAVVGNLTVTGQSAAGWLAVTPTTTVKTSNLNFPIRDVRANGFTCPLGANGSLTVTYGAVAGATTQVVVDVLGYYR